MTIQEVRHLCNLGNVEDSLVSLQSAYRQMLFSLGMPKAEEGYQRCVARMIDQFIAIRKNCFITDEQFATILDKIAEHLELHQDIKNGKKDRDVAIADVKEPLNSKGEENGFFATGLLIPKDLDSLPVLSTANTLFKAPRTIDLRDYCTETTNQGNRPWCAAHAAASFASNISWRRYGNPQYFNQEHIFKFAKKIDGSPNDSGTTLNAALEYFLSEGNFDKSLCTVKILRFYYQIKYAIHKFGCCLLGLNISEEWYSCSVTKSTISNPNYPLIGGHAVLCCGYNEDGVIIQNSWGQDWGSYGFALITWDELIREFIYGAVIENCLYSIKMN